MHHSPPFQTYTTSPLTAPPAHPQQQHHEQPNRWKKVLQPGLNKRHWTPEEDEIVRASVLSAQAIGAVSDSE